MQLQSEPRKFKSEMKAGVHLVTIFDMKLHKDSNKQIIQKDGEVGIVMTFLNGQNQYHEQVYWVGKGNAGKEKFFTQMCLDAMIDMSVTPLPKKAALNKRLWIAIREVYTLVNNGEDTLKDILGNEVIEHFIFHTAPIWDVEKQPTWKGDPKFNDGIACDDFVGYKDGVGEDGYVTINEETAKPFTLEVAQVTPEVEKAVVEKPKKEKKVKSLVERIAPLQDAMDKTEYQIQKAVFEAKATTTPMPNFGEATPTIKPSFDNEIILTEEEMRDISETDNMLHQGRQEASDMDEVLMQDNVDQSTPLPNFGDDQTPDTNF